MNYEQGGVRARKARRIFTQWRSGPFVQVWIDLDDCSAELVQLDRSPRFFGREENLVIDSLPEFALDLRTVFAF